MLRHIADEAHRFVPRSRRSSRLSVFYELYVAGGVADVVIVQFDRSAIAARRRRGTPPVDDYLSVAVLHTLRLGPLGSSSLAALLKVSRDHLVRQHLTPLSDSGLITQATDRTWKLARDYRPLALGIVAIEAKRADWLRAIHQARRYRRFANRSYIALDALASGRIEASREELDSHELGWASIDSQTGAVKIRADAPWRRPQSSIEFFLAAERAWAMQLSGIVSGPTQHVFGKWLPTAEEAPTSSGAPANRLVVAR